jgi:hypothetical protein
VDILNPLRAWRDLNWQHAFWSTLLGVVVLTFNLDAFLWHVGSTSLSDSWTGTIARGLGQTPARVVAPTRTLVSSSDAQTSALALTATLVLLEIYFVLVILHAARERGIRIIAASVAGIVGGALFLPLFIWVLAGVIALWRIAIVPILAGVLYVIHQIGAAIAFVLALTVVEGLIILLAGGVVLIILGRMLSGYVWGATLGLLAVIVMLVGSVPVVRMVCSLVARAVTWLADRVGALLAALWDLVAPLFSWLAPIMVTLAHWLAVAAAFLGWATVRVLFVVSLLILIVISTLIASVILASLVLLVFALPGALLIDQFRIAWNSGRGRGAVFNSSFSLGMALALVLIVSGGNPELLRLYDEAFEAIWRVPDQWDIARTLATFWPQSMENEILPYLSASQAPLFDGVLLLASAGLSCIGVLAIWKLPRDAATSRYSLIFPTVVITALSALLTLVLAAGMLVINSFGGSDA